MENFSYPPAKLILQCALILAPLALSLFIVFNSPNHRLPRWINCEWTEPMMHSRTRTRTIIRTTIIFGEENRNWNKKYLQNKIQKPHRTELGCSFQYFCHIILMQSSPAYLSRQAKNLPSRKLVIKISCLHLCYRLLQTLPVWSEAQRNKINSQYGWHMGWETSRIGV